MSWGADLRDREGVAGGEEPMSNEVESPEELVTVFWPGKATVACPRHLEKLVGLAAVLGFQLHWIPSQETSGCDNCRTEKEKASR